MKNILPIIILVVLANGLSAQNQNANWFFGDSLMLTFTDTGFITEQVPVICYETSASISDKIGNLLFYTDGKYIWNKLDTIMPDGCCMELDQYTPSFGSSVTQGAIIIPFPGDSTKYYIFHHAFESLKYSIVDMTLDGGLGDVTDKNMLAIDALLIEKLHAVKHANGRDWWVVVHKAIP